jgi:hypothetical protein
MPVWNLPVLMEGGKKFGRIKLHQTGQLTGLMQKAMITNQPKRTESLKQLLRSETCAPFAQDFSESAFTYSKARAS